MKTVRRAVDWMNIHLEPGLESAAANDRVMIVYYEDLIADTEYTVKKICAHTGLEFRRKCLPLRMAATGR